MNYWLKRAVWMLVSLWVLSALSFILLHKTGIDPTLIALERQGVTKQTHEDFIALYEQEHIKNGRNLPLFYFSIMPTHYPHSIQSIVDPEKRDIVTTLVEMGYRYDDIFPHLNDTVHDLESITKGLSKVNFPIPMIRWHGAANQYHTWLIKTLDGDFGYSHTDGRAVTEKVRSAFGWTLAFMVVYFMFLLFLFIPLLIWVSLYPAVFIWTERLTLLFYILPLFLIGTLVQVFLCNDTYGLNLFVQGRDTYFSDATFITKMSSFFQRHLPALMCIFMAEMAIMARLVGDHLTSALQKPYVKTALSKGLSKWQTHIRHVVTGVKIPLITVIAGGIPAFLSGSLIVETIFNIPGMGRLLYQSILKADGPTFSAIVLVIGSITIVTYAIADLLYKWADPRIKIGSAS